MNKKENRGIMYKTYTIEKSLKHHVIEWAATTLSVVGALLNAKLNIFGFYLFIIANLLWMSFSWKHKHWGLLVMNLIFLALNIYGIYTWTSQLT